MSTEPQRQIEKELKAYANKRRTEAGAPLELHPATRRLLHGEIARKTPQNTGVLHFLAKAFFQIWPRFAFIIPLIMLSGLVLLYKVLDNKPALEVASNVPASRAQLDDEPGSKDIVSKRIAEGARAEDRSDSPTSIPRELPQVKPALRDNQLAVAPQAAERKKVESSSLAAEKLSLKPASELAQQEAARTPSDANIVPAPAVVPSIQSPYLSRDGSGTESATQRFAQVSLIGSTSKTLGANLVLTSFQMERAGDQIRVIDKDGSTYVGHLQKVNAPPKQQIDDGRELINEARKAKAPASAPAKDSKSEVQTGPDYYFRVVGTNRNLNQPVIFSGRLLANAGRAGFSNTNPSTAAAGQLQGPAKNDGMPLLLNFRIDGTALVGGSNTLQIQAVPVPPR